jgi:peptidoglycan hydrolase-like protein with peptidoglycan-binding domain
MRASRSADDLDDDYDFEARIARPRRSSGLIVRAVDAALRNPVLAAGALVSGLAIIVIVTNALANQPMRHPSPLFRTRDIASSGAVPVATVPIIVGDNPLKPIADGQAPAQAAPKPAPTLVAAAEPAPVMPSAPQVSAPAAVPPLANLATQLTERIQQGLHERGFYTGAVDGIAGSGTTEAIRAFETRMGVAATGEVNDRVLALMKSERGRQMRAPAPLPVVPVAAKPIPIAAPAPLPAPAATHIGLMPAAVPPEPLTGSTEGRLQRVQRALNVAGYGPIRADGRFDERTGAAIRKYEGEHGLPVTGRLTERLMSELVVRSAEAR